MDEQSQLRKLCRAETPDVKAIGGGDGHGHDSGGHGDHENYDRDTPRRAILDGIDPAGEPLDDTTPRWTMSESDLNDLIAYLQQ